MFIKHINSYKSRRIIVPMEFDILDIGLAFIALLTFILSYFSEQYRIIAIMAGFILIIMVMMSNQNKKIQDMKEEQKRLQEKLKIHESIINIKADIQELQKKVFKR